MALGIAVALLATACQGRERTRPGVTMRGDTSVVETDGGVFDDASVDASPDDADLDAGTDTSPGDAFVPDTATPADSSTPPPDTATPPPDTCAPAPGALAIVEVMIASQSGTDQGEWFEIVNDGSCTVDLRGLEIGSPTTDGAPVTHSVSMGTIAPGAHFVFALSGDPTDNHELPWDYVYGSGMRSDVFLGNTGDVLTIAYGGVELDRIAWAAEDYARSVALQFPRGFSVSANDDLGLWCDASRVYSSSGGTFYGTPGAPNDGC